MKKILIVDDDAAIIRLLAEILKNEGHSISTADNGVEGLAKLREDKFDLLICDVWMPRMTGPELLTELRKLPDPPVSIMMSADDTPAVMLQSAREQAHHFLSKPFRHHEVLELVRATLAEPPPLPIEVISARPEWVELLVPCDLRSPDRISALLMRLKADLPEEVRMNLSQAFRELLLNAIEWGGNLDPNRKVRISFLRAKRMIIYRIADPGKGFNFDGLTHAAVSNPLDDPTGHMKVREAKGLRPGGLGLMIAQALVDELLFNEKQNEVVLIKYLEDHPPV